MKDLGDRAVERHGGGWGELAQWMFTTAISELHCVNKWLEPNWREARSQPHRHAGWDGDKDPEASFVPSLLGTRENAEPPHVPHPSPSAGAGTVARVAR